MLVLASAQNEINHLVTLSLMVNDIEFPFKINYVLALDLATTGPTRIQLLFFD